MLHKHHIIPKHMGGTDDPSNLIELTIEEHAEAHKILWEKYGKKEDYLAYLGLQNIISKEQILKELCSHKKENHPLYGKLGKDNPNFGKKRTMEQRKKISNSLKEYCKSRNEDHKKNLKKSHSNEDFLKKRGNKVARSWKITYPDNSIKIIHNLSEWCKEMNFHKASVCSAFKTNRKFNNYFFEKIT